MRTVASAEADVLVRPAPIPALRKVNWAILGLLPFFLFAVGFLILPSATLFIRSFENADGSFTLSNIIGLSQPFIREAYWLSIRISAVTAIGGGLFGFLLAYAAVLGRLPRFVRTTLMTFSGVASNFAGVPLAFAFIATLGQTGILTALLDDYLGLDLYSREVGFSLYSFMGLSLTYMYFQFPLMILIMAPALEGLRREWREASENLGGSTLQYWRYVALPILLPTLLGTIILLFGNAFGAYATAFALTGGSLNLVPIMIGAQLRGDVLHDPGLGNALAFGMVVIMTISMVGYSLVQRRSEKWLR